MLSIIYIIINMKPPENATTVLARASCAVLPDAGLVSFAVPGPVWVVCDGVILRLRLHHRPLLYHLRRAGWERGLRGDAMDEQSGA